MIAWVIFSSEHKHIAEVGKHELYNPAIPTKSYRVSTAILCMRNENVAPNVYVYHQGTNHLKYEIIRLGDFRLDVFLLLN